MFGKLMKYELRYLLRKYVPMWALVLLLCVSLCISFAIDDPTDAQMMSEESFLAEAILYITTALVMMSTGIVTVVVTLERFYKGVFGDEGYLLFTLPVTTGQIINAKAICALLMLIITTAVTVFGLWIVSTQMEGLSSFGSLYGSFMYYNDINPVSVALIAFWLIVLALLSLAQELYQVYLAISVGQLWKKHPIAGAILAFYAVQIAVSAVAVGIQRMVERNLFYLEDFILNLGSGNMVQFMIVIGIFAAKCLVMIGIFFFGTKLALEKRLELQ